MPPAQAKAQNGGGRPISPRADSVRSHRAMASSAMYRRTSGTEGTSAGLVSFRTKASSERVAAPGRLVISFGMPAA